MWEACNCNCNIIGLHSGTVLELVETCPYVPDRIGTQDFQSVYCLIWKKNMYYPITPKADIHNVTHTVLFHCPINAEIRAPEGQSDQSYSATRCLVFLKEYC